MASTNEAWEVFPVRMPNQVVGGEPGHYRRKRGRKPCRSGDVRLFPRIEDKGYCNTLADVAEHWRLLAEHRRLDDRVRRVTARDE